MNIRMRKYTILMFLMIFLASHSLAALTIKMGSLFPEGSSWDITLKKMAREWSEVTDGRVKIKIYPGGIAGEENDMDFDMRDFLPLVDDDFRDKGFEVLIWSKSGWINFFSNKEILTPDDLKSTRLAVSPNNPEMTEAFKALDLNVIPLGMNDTLMGLQSGMIDSFYSIPMISAAYQWFALAKNMNPIDMSPVIGGILISERTWKRIPEKYHDDLKASMAAVEQEFFKEYSRLNEEALRIMKDNDLNVLNPSQEVEQIWRDYFKDSYKTLVNNNMISEQIYQEMSQKLEAFRNGR
jgi:TRAP-type C4-dicarboxylate transport system substrate-binding protein